MRYCVIDFETTGLDPKIDEIVEFAAVRVEDGEIGLHIAQLCQPSGPIPPGATRVHGITDRMVRFAHPFSEYLSTFLDFIGQDTLVGHNLPFDFGFLQAACARAGCSFAPKKLCTLQMARRLYPQLPSRRLSAVAAHLGVKSCGYHRALGDAMATAGILLKMLA
ncbi:MAG: 3'-5' exonuclease [Oscillospiraceae bacterium]|nr:3'-5' exonuclease [Oscillospiraceae bacterium]